MDAKVIDFGNAKAIRIELDKDGKSISEALAEYFGVDVNDDDDDEDNCKELHDRLVEKLIKTREAVKSANINIYDAMDAAFKDNDPEDNTDCYCPCCLAKAAVSLTHDDIVEIGVDIVNAILNKCHKDLVIKTNRDLDAIHSVIERAEAIRRNKTKPIEDMSREELIAELKKKGK